MDFDELKYNLEQPFFLGHPLLRHPEDALWMEFATPEFTHWDDSLFTRQPLLQAMRGTSHRMHTMVNSFIPVPKY